jgi:hypothetical protein
MRLSEGAAADGGRIAAFRDISIKDQDFGKSSHALCCKRTTKLTRGG